jgi:tol-pal system protein YbgF
MAALRGASYDKAIASFREVVTNYPNGDLASNAQFWIGESYYTKGDLENAVTAYRKVLTVWPDSRKAPDAMVKLGFSLSDLEAHQRGAHYAGRSGAQVSGDQCSAACRRSSEAPWQIGNER